MWTAAREALERHFGYTDFRPGQGEAIGAVLAGRDALVIMPTGSGKSLCYQVPALVLPGLTLVVSPLIALMEDQVAALQRAGLPATLVNSTLAPDELEARVDEAVAGRVKLLYLAPERFGSPAFRRTLPRMRVAFVAVDEAHCVSEWGHDFRPSYLRLPEIWPLIGSPPILALTATATPEVRRDIIAEVGLRRPRVVVRGFDRPNLRWRVRREEKLAGKCRALLSAVEGAGGSSVIYGSTRKMVESATELLRSAGAVAVAYHAGLPQAARAEAQRAWTSGRVPIVVATNAFGMGIDKPDVRRVIHFQMPGSLEAYYQEAGRAGRDGEPADCLLLHGYGDRFIHEFFIRSAYPPRKVVVAMYRVLARAAASGPVRASRFVRRVPGVKSEREAYSALRILTEAGCVVNLAREATCTVRWIARPERVETLTVALEAGNEAGGIFSDIEACAVLSGLARASGHGRRRFLRMERREIGRWVPGGYPAARRGLDALQAAGLLGWRDDGSAAGYAVTDVRMSPETIPVDWEKVGRRRALEMRKLRSMEGYAYARECRRRYLLRYFGEAYGRSRCGGCDRCGCRDPAVSV